MSGQHIMGELLSPGNGWTGFLRGRTIELKFSSAAVCGTPQDPYLPDWDGVPLALTIDSSVPPSDLSPLPDGHSGNSYTWNFPRLNCQAPPDLTASVPVSLPTYLATEVNNSTAFGGLGVLLAGWSSQIILLLFATYFWLRYRRAYAGGAGLGFFLIAITTLGFAAVAASSLSNGPLSDAAVLVGIYGVIFSLAVTRPPRDRLLIAAAAISLTAVLLWVSYSNVLGIDAFATPVLGVALLVEAAAAVLAVAGGFCAFRRLRRVVFGGLVRSTKGRLATRLDLAVFCGGTAILAAVAYSAGNIQVPTSLATFAFSEISTLQYCIPAFSLALIAAALIIPFLPGDPAAGRWRLWYGPLGFAAAPKFI